MGRIDDQKVKSKSGTTLVLRSAVQADAGKINDLATEVFQSSEYLVTTSEEFSSFSEDQQRERLKKFEENENDILLVVEHENQLIGMLDFQVGKRKKTAHRGTFGMSVRSSWQNKGIGTLLLSALIEWAKKKSDIEVISLGVMEENRAALLLYSKMGFEITGREPFGFKLADGKFMVDLSMSLRLER